MERKNRKNRFYGKNGNNYIILAIVMAIFAIIAFIVSYILYSNKIEKQLKMSSNENVENQSVAGVLNITTNNVESSEVSSLIGKSVNEVQEENTKKETTNETVQKYAINTSKIENSVKSNNVKTENKTEYKELEEVEEAEEIEDVAVEIPNFIKPVDGDIIKDYSSDILVYSQTLEEWTTHLGIDYVAEKTSIVKASASGTIKSIKNDPRYGLTIIIEHEEGFSSMYSNLLSTEFVEVGEYVEQGQTIGTVGNTAVFEIADETHLHFAILKDGNFVDPNLYLK